MSRVPQRQAWSSQQLNRFYQAAMIALALWLAAWLMVPWNSLHDTALAYLRVATDLDANRSIWGGGSDWGTGRLSLLYVPLLMLVRSVLNYAIVLRVVSTAGYVLLFGRLALALAERVRRAGPLTLLLSILLLAVLCAPPAVYWLNDGTESTFALFLVLVMVLRTRRVMRHGTSSSWQLAVWSVLSVLLRAEMFYETMAICLMLSLWGTDTLTSESSAGTSRSGRTAVATPWQTPLVAGLIGLVALIIIRLVLQIGLPLHIAFSPASWGWAFVSAGDSLLEARSLGWGLLLLWILSAVLAQRVPHSVKAGRVANGLPLFVLAMLALRGQQISFAAELAWPLFFAILWNLLEISTAERDRAVAMPLVRQGAAMVIGLIVLLMV